MHPIKKYVAFKIQKGPLGIMPFFIVCVCVGGEGDTCNNLSFFTLNGMSQHAQHYQTLRHFTEVEAPKFSQIYFSPFDMQMSYQ